MLSKPAAKSIDLVEIMPNSTKDYLNVLMESYPLTIKRGTGIYKYSASLLQALNQLGLQNVGLLLLFENSIRLPWMLGQNKSAYTLTNRYAKLLHRVYRSYNARPFYRRKKQKNKRLILYFTHQVIRYADILFSFLYRLVITHLPDYMMPSLMEIIGGDDSLNLDLLSKNCPYVINLSRAQLSFKTLLGIKNTVSEKHLGTAYDVLHCTHLSPIIVQGIPRVTTVHDIIPLLRPELVSQSLSVVFSKLLELNLKESTKIIAVSETTKRDLVNFCDVPAQKITVVYEAASEEFQPIPPTEAFPILLSLNLMDGQAQPLPYFLFIGNIEPKKNIRRLLQAFQEFSLKEGGQHKLVIVGTKAWGYQSVRPLIQTMSKAGCLLITGYLPRSFLPALLSHAKGFLFPSLVEGFGLPVLEAMACGCPVITSDIPAITEVCAGAAIQVNPHSLAAIRQAIEQVATTESIRSKLREEGLNRSRKFSWQRCAQETLEVYKEACQLYRQ